MAGPRSDPTAVVATGLVKSSATQIHSIIVSTSTGNASLSLWNRASSVNCPISTRKMLFSVLADSTETFCPSIPVQMDTGLFASLAGVGAMATVNLRDKA